jgi:hypothetical protein
LGTLLNPYLKHDAHGAKRPGLEDTCEGQASIAVPELGETCGRCIYLDGHGDRYGAAPCLKFVAMTPRMTPQCAPKIRPNAVACRFFERRGE